MAGATPVVRRRRQAPSSAPAPGPEPPRSSRRRAGIPTARQPAEREALDDCKQRGPRRGPLPGARSPGGLWGRRVPSPAGQGGRVRLAARGGSDGPPAAGARGRSRAPRASAGPPLAAGLGPGCPLRRGRRRGRRAGHCPGPGDRARRAGVAGHDGALGMPRGAAVRGPEHSRQPAPRAAVRRRGGGGREPRQRPRCRRHLRPGGRAPRPGPHRPLRRGPLARRMAGHPAPRAGAAPEAAHAVPDGVPAFPAIEESRPGGGDR